MIQILHMSTYIFIEKQTDQGFRKKLPCIFCDIKRHTRNNQTIFDR